MYFIRDCCYVRLFKKSEVKLTHATYFRNIFILMMLFFSKQCLRINDVRESTIGLSIADIRMFRALNRAMCYLYHEEGP